MGLGWSQPPDKVQWKGVTSCRFVIFIHSTTTELIGAVLDAFAVVRSVRLLTARAHYIKCMRSVGMARGQTEPPPPPFRFSIKRKGTPVRTSPPFPFTVSIGSDDLSLSRVGCRNPSVYIKKKKGEEKNRLLY
ncbi:hypothetical protein CDAR_28711 [Caerostris darwini]|uniref:Uncharacterized protein n=1 Tax=Caerostris darwini TaxID=1538125 RepID=A0AAV4Q5J1_9ARAC|nr:hypothetical protein CDAR_28711 [Caerostris darwini]